MVVGQLIADRYELKNVVGTGGMSSVYCAYDTLLERNVALKILHEQYEDSPIYPRPAFPKQVFQSAFSDTRFAQLSSFH